MLPRPITRNTRVEGPPAPRRGARAHPGTTYACGPSPFLEGLWDVFPNGLAVHDITNSTPGVMVESYPGLAKRPPAREASPRVEETG